MNRKIILFLAMMLTILVGWLLTWQVYAAGTTAVVNGSGDLNDFNPETDFVTSYQTRGKLPYQQ